MARAGYLLPPFQSTQNVKTANNEQRRLIVAPPVMVIQLGKFSMLSFLFVNPWFHEIYLQWMSEYDHTQRRTKQEIDTWDHTPPPLAKMLTWFLLTPGVTHSWCSRWTWLSQTCCPEYSHQRKSVHFHNPANLEAVEAGLSPHYNCWQQLYTAISEQDVLILKQDHILGGKLHKGEAEWLPNSRELMRGQPNPLLCSD